MEELEILKSKFQDLLKTKYSLIDDHNDVIRIVKVVLNKYDFYVNFPSFVINFDELNRLIEKIKHFLHHLDWLCMPFEEELKAVILEIVGWFEGFIVMKKLFEEK
ncbi:hypothetical protein D3C76_230500 [compost metagenome]